ncbi:hypothetical protein B0T26DRAFT_808878 [Lasiosphaeria miniovina]|uniref:Swi5-dependent recombination DNA repair protein 1 n=1 Tax=Lasiosphaeria miniovina TaxID=1954250 RepID=A0AA40BHQ9_9PEZI|nr:uncharacterized protein B0T26DRAFT_808878 [Lasiosphaeria miniovina]KAK0734399.1 hypothetical protein B0T26DRAFT_808878 [Lasiosphaeria miniovina]
MSSSSQTPGPAAANKRRRAEAANVALRKPFRSPMISRQAATAGEGDDGTRAGAANASPNVARAAAGAEAAARAVATAGTPRANPATRRGGHGAWPSTPASASRGSPLNQPSMRGSSSSLASRSGNSRLETLLAGKVSKKSSGSGQVLRRDGDVDDNDDYDAEDLLERMRQAERETGAHVRQLQQELNVVRQAKRIEQQSEQSRRLRRQSPPTAPTGDGGPSIIDAELRELVGKWKFASQQAAEELFELIKGRVAGMGGGKAWRETRRQQQQGFFAGFDDGDGHGSGATRRDHERDCNEECRCDDDDDDDDFTMLMMLKSLNIDPNVLGYDAVEDKWRD